MNYSIENLADYIQSSIEFEESELEQFVIDDEYQYNDYLATFEGYARGLVTQRGQGEPELHDIHIKCVVLIDKYGEHKNLSEEDLIKLESLIEW